MNWQSIDSAPRDGTVVRVKNGCMDRSVKARFGDYHSDVTGKVYPHTWVLVEDDLEEFMPLRPGLMVVPTHWAPIKNEATP